mgnify:FL=1
MFTRDGQIYGIPSTVSPMLFGYNKALFEEAGLTEPPKTWEEALDMAKKSMTLKIRLQATQLWLLNGQNGSSSTMYGRQAVI